MGHAGRGRDAGGDLFLPVGNRAGLGHPAPVPGRWRHTAVLDAADGVGPDRRTRRSFGRDPAGRRGGRPGFPRAELARPATGIRGLRRPRSRRPRRRLRSGRAGDRGTPWPARHRYAGRRPARTDRRQLAQALSCAHAAQQGPGQPPALHALPAELAGLHPEGQARQLVRSLCRRHGAERLDRHRIPWRQL